MKPQLQLDKQLCFALYAASRAMTQAYQPLLAPLGLTYPQYLAMLVLWENDDISMKQLGERLQLDSGTLTPLLKRLESAGLLQRRRSSSDERSVVIRLTAAGKQLEEQAATIPGTLSCRFGDVGSERSAQLRDTLQQLTRLLQGCTLP
ncbi:MarR family winged helix-turn-helix transcriptional regulator [Vogesella facilis]|uniref:MarR family winged helix-turn-helix transcriptional regulator n=1 Tax=Vogesella facilis TaxID=1655232 RepID=A0ABV7RHT1_9NEIS